MPAIKVTVEPKSKNHVGWFVQLFSWKNDYRDLVSHRLELKSSADGKFKFESGNLPSDEYGLRLHIHGSGNSAKATVDGKPPIAYPRGKNWPMTIKVPPEYTQYSDTWYFNHGGSNA